MAPATPLHFLARAHSMPSMSSVQLSISKTLAITYDPHPIHVVSSVGMQWSPLGRWTECGQQGEWWHGVVVVTARLIMSDPLRILT